MFPEAHTFASQEALEKSLKGAKTLVTAPGSRPDDFELMYDSKGHSGGTINFERNLRSALSSVKHSLQSWNFDSCLLNLGPPRCSA